MRTRDLTTKDRPRGRRMRRSTPIPALTIICHRDLSRIGERAFLHGLTRGRAVELSRSAPDFAHPGTALGMPLDDPYVSRSAITLRPHASGGVLLERHGSRMRLNVGGEPFEETLVLPQEACRAGVDLELGESVVLLLHTALDTWEPATERFGLIGESDAICETRQAITRVADLDLPVLLRGESGTGKELVARAIHEHGQRRDGPFVAVNLSAITPTLAAAELFGTTKGAFTGAVARRGFFRAADGGTLFLDEVGECPADVQAMLLRALETSEFYPVGSHAPQRANVRLVAATDSDLEAKTRLGTFKEPLLHRLAAYEIWLAPLRERREDVGRLFVHFARQALRMIGQELPRSTGDSSSTWLPSELAARLSRHHWRGNIRQLRNLVQQLSIESRATAHLGMNARLESTLAESERRCSAQEAPGAGPAVRRPSELTDSELISAMKASNWDVASAARTLGVSRPSLYDLIRRSPNLRIAQDLEPEEIARAIDEADGNIDRAAAGLRVSARGLRRRLRAFD